MSLVETRVVMRLADVPGAHRLDVYEANGGYAALRKALSQMEPEEVMGEVKASGLRGKGGAGFPAGLKWSFVPRDHPGPKYLACNADEGEPGTFKDRWILEHVPHLLIEGCILCAYAVGISHIYVYCRGEFARGKKMLEDATREAYAKGYLGENILGSGFSTQLTVHSGAGSYECGEETALLTSLEGGRGHPKNKPPFPATHGAWAKPTVINNVETLATVPDIITRGAAWYAGMGIEKSKGVKMVSICGHVVRPGIYEVEFGVPIADIIALAGGVSSGRALKGFFPGGSSTPVLPASQTGISYDYESVAAAGSMLGSGGLIVFDETTDVVKMAEVITRFYAWESCGKCTPCREGTRWMLQTYERILQGKGKPGDTELLLSICDNIEFKSFCPFGDAAVGVVRSTVKYYPEEYDAYIRRGKAIKRAFTPMRH
jgi:NADH-quinone oxidoreductase subunit F